MSEASDADRDAIHRDFKEVVNMSATSLEAFLDTPESKAVGQKEEGGESTGHRSGRRIVALLGTSKADLTPDDYAHMKKVVGYVHRHLKQGGPKDKAETETSPWRYSLMNWGHDPLKR